MKITILGGSGFIGSHLAKALAHTNADHDVPARGEDLRGRALGAVVYCIGLTADFRTRPLEAVEAHVTRLVELARTTTFDSLTYLSSTRVYRRCSSPVDEETMVCMAPLDADDLYDISKVMGEAVALTTECPTRIVRLSNVYGPDATSSNFLASLLRDAVVDGEVCLRTTIDSWKDYVSIDDVVRTLPAIALEGTQSVYNLASGVNVTHGEITSCLAALTGCAVRIAESASRSQPPTIDIARIRDEFGFRPASVLDDMPQLLSTYRGILQPGA